MTNIDISGKFKLLLQQHAADLFALHDTLNSLAYSQVSRPIIRYARGIQSDAELYWCGTENPPAELEIVWANHFRSYTLRLNGHTASDLPAPPTDIQAKALALLRELDSKRELVALYRCGYFEDGKFVLSNWLIAFPEGYDKSKSDIDHGAHGAGAYLTVTRDGGLGLASPYTDDKKLCATLGL